MAIMASGVWNPNARRVWTRMRVLIDSIRALDRSWVSASRIAS